MSAPTLLEFSPRPLTPPASGDVEPNSLYQILIRTDGDGVKSQVLAKMESEQVLKLGTGTSLELSAYVPLGVRSIELALDYAVVTETTRTGAITHAASVLIAGYYKVPTRLRILREMHQLLQRRLSGDVLSGDELAWAQGNWQTWVWPRLVREYSQALIADVTKTVDDAVWPLLEDAPSEELPAVWSTGIPLTVLDGYSADVTAKVNAAISALIGSAPDSLNTLQELATYLSNTGNAASALAAQYAALSAALTQEVTDRGTAAATLQGAIESEASTRADMDSELDDRLTAIETALPAEATTRGAADATNATAIITEATARASADTTNATAIATEATARASAVSGEVTTRAAADATEQTARIAGDAANSTAITNEGTSRVAGDSTNTAAITSEASTRASADTSLQGQIDTLTAARKLGLQNVSGTATLASANRHVVADTTGGAFTITLPTVSDAANIGLPLAIVNVGTKVLTLAGAFLGAATYKLGSKGNSGLFYSDGTTWQQY